MEPKNAKMRELNGHIAANGYTEKGTIGNDM
jgi:hypothetical protein